MCALSCGQVHLFNRTLTKYILIELIGPFSLGLLIFTFILLMDRVLRLVESVISKGVSLKTVLEMLIYLMPSLLVLTVPMAVLAATLTAFGRLSTDSEITAMKASGISLYTLFVPVVFFAVAASGITFFLYARALPWGSQKFLVTQYELVRTKASVGLKEKIFINDIFHGAIHPKSVEKPLKYQILTFPALDIVLSLQKENAQPKKEHTQPSNRKVMTITQLYERYVELRQQDSTSGNPNPENTLEKENPSSQEQGIVTYLMMAKYFFWDSFFFLSPLSSPYLVELHKRFAFPWACLVFGLIGLPLGIQSRRAGKSGGYAISVVLLLIYYIFIHAGEALGVGGRLPVFFAVWTPNILLGITGMFLLIRVARR